MIKAVNITKCGDNRVNGTFFEAQYLSQNQSLQFWHSSPKSTVKIKSGLRNIPEMPLAWVIIEINKVKPLESIILYAAPGKPEDSCPPESGWKAIGGIGNSLTCETYEANANETLVGRQKSLSHLYTRVENLCTRQFIFTMSAEIHGGVKGLYDYGPTGCAIKSNMIDQWKNHFIINDDMLEIESTVLTPYPVLKASGHVDKFSDFMCKDVVTLEPHRADHLLEQHIEDLILKSPDMSEEEIKKHRAVAGLADAMTREELGDALKNYGIKAPETGNELTEPYEFNLMFSTQIGPTGKTPGYLRPETAQGIFVNFKKLLDFNRGQVPFAAAQVGLSFRNEIAPRNGLIRVREFQQAEIEHFCGLDEGEYHPRFTEVENIELALLTKANQDGDDTIIRMPVGVAVSEGLISSQTLGYYLARTQLFFKSIGVNLNHCRFRQHKDSEMAHYARDCWDAELLTTSVGWLEVVGHADRACFDLSNHAKVTGIDLRAQVLLDEPVEEVAIHKKPNKRAIGKTFRRESKNVLEYIDDLSDEDCRALYHKLQKEDTVTINTCQGDYDLTKEMLDIVEKTVMVYTKSFYPAVVEPSFGIGRILCALLEHLYWERPEDENRSVLSLPPKIAPYKCSVLPLSKNSDLKVASNAVHLVLKRAGFSTRIDSSGVGIGRKYARSDEVGVPFAITIDFITLENQTVTVRERDSCSQIRLPIEELPNLLGPLVNQDTTWEEISANYEQVDDAEN